VTGPALMLSGPWRPRYVSTVDSGNLLASLWTFETSCDEWAMRPLLDAGALRGITDTLNVLRQIVDTMKEAERPSAFLRLAELTRGQPVDLEEIIMRVRAARQPAQDLLLHYRGEETEPRTYWAQQILEQVAALLLKAAQGWCGCSLFMSGERTTRFPPTYANGSIFSLPRWSSRAGTPR